jgi:hypothetical protein
MQATAETVAFRGWKRALRISNGLAEVVATLEVGPRILSYTRGGGLNPLAIYDEQAGGCGEPQWKNRGGHRLWLAPEAPDFSYHPDNSPVDWKPIAGGGFRLIPAPEGSTGFAKEIDLFLAPEGAAMTVVHRIRRTGASPRRAAPWALSVMAPGGFAVMPQPPLGRHPQDLLPNRRLVVWPYTDLSDPRYRFGCRFFTMRQDPARGPTKIGLRSEVGWAAYVLGDRCFRKRFAPAAGGDHPDDGCNLEVFTNARMLELESLGTLRDLAPGETAEWTEEWDLLPVAPGLRPDDEDALGALAPV